MFLEELRAPIAADAPSGRDIRDDDEFDALKTEIGKQSSVSSRTDFDRLVQRGSDLIKGRADSNGATPLVEDSAGPDFSRVIGLSTNILTRKSKHLQVAGYLCFALFRTERYAGLADGLESLRAMIEGYWDSLFPEARRIEGRRQAIQWLAQRIADLVPVWPPEPDERDAVERAIATCRAIDAMLRERVVEEPPSLSMLARALTEAIDVLPAPRAAAVAPAPTSAGAPTAVVITPSAAPAEIASEDDADLAVARASDYFRGSQATNPVGYRLLRVLRWDGIPDLPSREGNRTPFPPPSESYRTRLEIAQGSGAWSDLLTACEEIFYEVPNHFWLDVQRFADQALGGLGPDHAATRRLLRHEVARLLERLPGIEDLAFSDGTAFADPATRDWLEREIRTLSAGGGASAPAPAEEDDALAQLLSDAEALAGGGDLAGAVDALAVRKSAEPTRRGKFRCQLHTARLLFTHGKPEAAKPLLEELDEQIERYGLKDWEPDRCLTVWSLMRRCYEQLSGQASPQAQVDYLARSERCFDKMCRLDVRLALREGRL
jgi:type VI secretion system protein VasJ